MAVTFEEVTRQAQAVSAALMAMMEAERVYVHLLIDLPAWAWVLRFSARWKAYKKAKEMKDLSLGVYMEEFSKMLKMAMEAKIL